MTFSTDFNSKPKRKLGKLPFMTPNVLETQNTLVNSKRESIVSFSPKNRINHFIEINKVLNPDQALSPLVKVPLGRKHRINQSLVLKPTLPIRPDEIKNFKHIKLQKLKDQHLMLKKSIDDRQALILDKCNQFNLELSDQEKLSFMKLPMDVAQQFLTRRIEAHLKHKAAKKVQDVLRQYLEVARRKKRENDMAVRIQKWWRRYKCLMFFKS